MNPLLVAHGTRKVHGVAMIADLAERVSGHLGQRVRTAFVDVLGLTPADVLSALPDGAAVVVPAFLASGHHVRVDIPRFVEASGHPNETVTDALGPSPHIVRVLIDRLVESSWRPSDSVIVAAAGTSDPRAERDLRITAALLSAAIGRRVELAYAATGEPRVADAVTALRSDGARRVVVASYLLADGLFQDRLHQSGADVVTAPLGTHAGVARLIASRFRRARLPVPPEGPPCAPAETTVSDGNRRFSVTNRSLGAFRGGVMTQSAVLNTYRFLRGGMPVMIVLLGAAVLIERLHATCWQTSISAYYFTSAHAIFIAALCAIGAMLIVYKGSSDTEDVLLNLAGVLAFVVAMVPTSRPVLFSGCADLNIGIQSAIANVWAVVIALVVSRAASWWMYRRTGTAPRRSALGTAAVWGQRLLLAVGVVTLVLAPDWFRTNAHGVAAVAMFASVILTVVITAFVAGNQDADKCPHRRRYQLIYQWISAVMVLTLAAAVCLHQILDRFNHAVIVVEAALIIEFAAYWVVQTIELWGTPTRGSLMAERDTSDSRILRAL